MSTSKKSSSTKAEVKKETKEAGTIKRNLSKQENDTLHSLIQLIIAKKSPSLANLAGCMSTLSEDQRKLIGRGQKSLQKYLQRHSDIFSLRDGQVSVQPNYLPERSAAAMANDQGLQQVVCVVTKAIYGFGFLRTLEGANIYFGANVFETGLLQDLTQVLSIGDVVLVDAVKCDPSYDADWQATRVRRTSKKQKLAKDSQLGSCSSLDDISSGIPFASGNRQFSWDSLMQPNAAKTRERIVTTSSTTSESVFLETTEREIIQFLLDRIEKKGGSLSIQHLTGHVSALSQYQRNIVGTSMAQLKSFLTKHDKYFRLEGDVVHNTNFGLSESNSDDEATSTTSSSRTNSSNAPFKSLQDVRGTVVDDSTIRLSNGELATFTERGFSKNSVIICRIIRSNVTGGNRWKATEVRAASPLATPTSLPRTLRGYVGTIVSVFPTYGFIQHRNNEDDNIYFHKDVVWINGYPVIDPLDKVFSVNDTVICDADLVRGFRTNYKAIRVTNLKVNRTANSTATVPPAVNSLSTLDSFSPIGSEVGDNEAVGNDVYISEEEWEVDSQPEELVNCKGKIMTLLPTFGFIQRGKRGLDPENVYFNAQSLFVPNVRKVENLEKHLKLNQTVVCDAVRSFENASCKWRATIVWLDDHFQDPGTGCEKRETKVGTIVKVFPLKGVISFPPNNHQVLFSVGVFLDDNHKQVSDLTKYLTEGQVVHFTVKTDDGGLLTRWRAVCVWTELVVPEPKPITITDTTITGHQGRVVAIKSNRGIINFGKTKYHDEVHFSVEVFYDSNGTQVQTLDWSLKVGDSVKFDAVLEQPGMKAKWKALLVWKGERPKVMTSSDKKTKLAEYLKMYHPIVTDFEGEEPDKTTKVFDDAIVRRTGTIDQLTDTGGFIRANLSNKKETLIRFDLDRVYVDNVPAERDQLSVGDGVSFDASSISESGEEENWVVLCVYKGPRPSSVMEGLDAVELSDLESTFYTEPIKKTKAPAVPDPIVYLKPEPSVYGDPILVSCNPTAPALPVPRLVSFNPTAPALPEPILVSRDPTAPARPDPILVPLDVPRFGYDLKEPPLQKVTLPNGKELIPWDVSDAKSSESVPHSDSRAEPEMNVSDTNDSDVITACSNGSSTKGSKGSSIKDSTSLPFVSFGSLDDVDEPQSPSPTPSQSISGDKLYHPSGPVWNQNPLDHPRGSSSPMPMVPLMAAGPSLPLGLQWQQSNMAHVMSGRPVFATPDADIQSLQFSFNSCFQMLQNVRLKTMEAMKNRGCSQTATPLANGVRDECLKCHSPIEGPKMADASTQTTFTGEIFCSNVYSGQ